MYENPRLGENKKAKKNDQTCHAFRSHIVIPTEALRIWFEIHSSFLDKGSRKMNNRKRVQVLGLIAALLFFGTIPAQADILSLGFSNLMPLDEGTDGLYEGWAIIGGSPVSTGLFNVNGSGQTVAPGTGDPIDVFDVGLDLTGATAIKISLEPVGDADPAPSGLIVLTGDVIGDEAMLYAALPGLDMLSNAKGTYILATPSDNDTYPDNDDQGVWFLAMPGPMAGLTGLPDLGANWTYEGWAVNVSGGSPMPYSTGTFDDPDGFDSDEAGCNGGGPPFPGQDFSDFHCGPTLDLDSGDFVLVISIEPVPDNSPGPFQFKPLAGAVPTDALGMANMLGNQTSETFPTGIANISGLSATSETTWGDLKAIFR
jgi:hypothetical protein